MSRIININLGEQRCEPYVTFGKDVRCQEFLCLKSSRNVWGFVTCLIILLFHILYSSFVRFCCHFVTPTPVSEFLVLSMAALVCCAKSLEIGYGNLVLALSMSLLVYLNFL